MDSFGMERKPLLFGGWAFLGRRVLPLFCAALVCTLLWAEAGQAHLAQGVIRLHVLANSDAPADQALKLQVRDRVLEEAAALLSGCTDENQAEALLEAALPRLTQAAQEEVLAQGYDYPVTAKLADTWFPTRQYEGVALPAGTYHALRVLIGEGEGQNWWCVVFPSLCLGAVSERAAQTAGISGQDYALITEESQPYVIKFRTVELWENFRHWVTEG